MSNHRRRQQNITLRHILDLNADVFTFDTFDTVLVRNTATPAGIFYLIQRRLQNCNSLPSSLLHDFVRFRIQADQMAQQRTKNEEITISQIYAELGKLFSLSSDVQEFLINLELKEEINAVSGIPQILDLINSVRSRKTRIAFLSDTYLPKNAIQKMLEKVGAWEGGDKLYVSSELLITKVTGNLFRHVLKQEQCQPNCLVHIGDNLNADVIAARQVGVRAFQFKKAELNRYENAILGEELSFQGYQWQLLAGAARMARLTSDEKSNISHTLYCLGTSIVGPTFLCFILWVLREAKACKMQRLYFVARDGQILLEVAKRLVELLDLKLDLHYLYGSRQAWHLASMTELGEREFEWLFDPAVSIRALSNRAGLNPESVQNEIYSISGKRLEIDNNLSSVEIEQLRNIILHSELKNEILNRALEERAAALGYFSQEGLIDDIPWGIVDLGWSGNCQDSLKRILETGGITNNIYGFYFGLSRSTSDCRGNRKLALFPQNSEKNLLNIVENFALLLEIFASADHGITLSYYNDGDAYCPRLKTPFNEEVLDWGLANLREGIFHFLDHLTVDLLEELWCDTNLDKYRKRVALCMKLLGYDPHAQEGEAIGSCPYSTDQAETYLNIFAPPFSALNAIRYNLSCGWEKKQCLTRWVDGTRSRSDLIPRLLLHPKIRKTSELLICGLPRLLRRKALRRQKSSTRLNKTSFNTA